jgi:UDP-N-acetylglucosamine acyltransferase
MKNEIHPTAIIGDNVKIGINNKILPFTIIYGPTEIGDNNIIGPNVIIGTPGQDPRNPRYDSSNAQFILVAIISFENLLRFKSLVTKKRLGY